MTNEPDDRLNVGTKDATSGGLARKAIFAAGGGLALVALATAAVQLEIVPRWLIGAGSEIDETAAAIEPSDLFTPPLPDMIPDGPFGEAVRRGEAIFTNTATNASDHVGNGLSCSNCHLDAGRHPKSAPMWAAWVTYPKYRSKNNQINTMEDRVRGCFTYSMNAQYSPTGKPPPVGDDIYRDLQSYFFWMATNAPTNVALEGIGFGKVEKPEVGYDLARGADVYQAKCSVCHGDDGQGQRDLNGDYTFPPLWGSDSFNWGAGMGRINTAAAFIKNNMPLSQPGSLTDQEAWDVAAFVDSHERPKDPRQSGTIEENRLANHDGDETLYGQVVNGAVLGQGTGPSAARAATMPEAQGN
jgi:thiosulfate dehydrogenase